MTKITRFLSVKSFVLLILLSSSAPADRAQEPETLPRCRSALQITASRAFQLLVIAPNDLETGFDPFVGRLFQEIPSSHYYEEPTRSVKVAIGTPAAGRYFVQVLGSPSEKFTVTFTASDERGASTSRKFSGVIWPRWTLVYIVHYSPRPGAGFSVTPLTPFSDFSAKLDSSHILIPPPSFRVSATFVLGSPSTRFDPTAQPVSFWVDNYAVTIPPGSFIRDKQGKYSFEGTVAGIPLQAQIVPQGKEKFAFNLKVQGTLTLMQNVVRFLLILGGNAGVTRACDDCSRSSPSAAIHPVTAPRLLFARSHPAPRNPCL